LYTCITSFVAQVKEALWDKTVGGSSSGAAAADGGAAADKEGCGGRHTPLLLHLVAKVLK